MKSLLRFLTLIDCLHFECLLDFISISIEDRTFSGEAFTETNDYDLL